MLVNGSQAKLLFNAAREGHWAIGAFNIMDYITGEAVISAAEELDVPVCLQLMDGYNPEAPEGSRMIRVSDRATLFNLLTGLNGYTISSGVIEQELNPEIRAIPLIEKGYMDIVILRHKDITPNPLTDTYVNYLKESLPESCLITEDDDIADAEQTL